MDVVAARGPGVRRALFGAGSGETGPPAGQTAPSPGQVTSPPGRIGPVGDARTLAVVAPCSP
jgi:hypothetical protein